MNESSSPRSAALAPAARRYVAAVGVAGLAAAAATLARGPLEPRVELLVLCGLAVALGSRTVRLWSTVEMSVALPFIYAALLQHGTAAATLVSLLAALGACLVRSRRLDGARILFNTSVIAGTTVAASWAYLAMGGAIGEASIAGSFWPLAGSTLVYYALNTGLIAGIIHLTQGLPLPRVWKENFVWSAPSYFTGSSLGLALVLLLSRFGPAAFAMALPPCVLIYYFIRFYMEKMEMQRRQLEQAAAMNRVLETKVEERTRELVAVNRKLEEFNLQLQTSNRLKSQFLANVSHELRTPLNAIIGFSELLMNDARRPLGPEQHEYVRDILSSGRHLLDLINDILDLSKIEAGKMELSVEQLHLRDVLEMALSTIKPLAADKRIELSVSDTSEPAPITADPAKVKQILYNLLSNAVKFTPEGGRVAVSVSRRAGFVSIAVTDTGIGIAPQDRERIFSEFLQLDGSYARRYQGTGLGLALVKRYVEMHGGRIHVESAEGSGSRFVFELPAGGPEQAEEASRRDEPEAAGAAPGSPSGGGRTILVVEDNPLNAKLVRRVLQESGHRVVEARSGREALEQARRVRPDLILMDLQLPDMDGLEAARSLKGDAATRAIPTVALTAHAMKGDDERAREAGCCGYITKPIDVVRFPATIASLLHQEAAA
ncbi:MAG TPA: ATP-binding protein [Candidatus Polarisedimenticolia bacterium]|nr:ATP-binding protein [Candidatus Polarisedimenticolia bacterium]